MAGYRCSDAFRGLFYPGLFSPGPPLLAALSVSTCHRGWRDEVGGTCDPPGFTMEKSGSGIHVALQSSVQKNITHGLTNTYSCTHPYAHTPTDTHTFKDPPSTSFQSTQPNPIPLHPTILQKTFLTVIHQKLDKVHTDSAETEHINTILIIGDD